MEKELTLLLNLIKSYVFNKKIEIDGVNEQLLIETYKLAKSQELAHLLGYFAKGLEIDKKLKEKLELEVNVSLDRLSKIEYVYNKTKDLLEANEINHMLLKGSEIAKYYANPYLRLSCDLDIYVDEKDVKKVHNLLVNNGGFVFKHKSSHDYSFLSQEGVLLEVHYKLNDFAFNKELIGAFKNPFYNSQKISDYTYRMNDKLFYLYFICHIARHLINGGCGLKAIIDYKILNENFIKENIEIKELTYSLGLKDLDVQLNLLCEYLFEDKTPNDITLSFSNYVLNGGAYGSNQNNVLANNANGDYVKGKIWLKKNQLKSYFSKDKICAILIPFYQIRRWLDIIFKNRIKSSLKRVKINKNLSKEEKERVKTLFNALKINDL